MRIIFLSLLMLFVATCKDDSSDSAECSEQGTYMLVGTKSDDDGVPAFYETLHNNDYKDAKTQEIKNETGKVTNRYVYDEPQPDGTTLSRYYGEKEVLYGRERSTLDAEGRVVARKLENLDINGEVESTEEGTREYDADGRVIKITTTITGGERDGETSTQTFEYDGDGRTLKEEYVSNDSTFDTEYNYDTNEVVEVNVEKAMSEDEEDQTTTTTSRYRTIEGGSPVVLLHQRKTTSSLTKVIDLECKDVGRRIDCTGNYLNEETGAFLGRTEQSLVLYRRERCDTPSQFEEHELSSLEASTASGDTSTYETTDAANAGGKREKVETSSYEDQDGVQRGSKSVTTYDETNLNPVKRVSYDADELAGTETWTYE